jgi:putative hydrolase of the HAD superfamily
MPVCAVLFDAVGTLIVPDPPVAEAYHLAAWSCGSQLSLAQVRARFHAAWNARTLARRDLAAGELARLPTSEAAEREFWREIVAQVFDDVADEHERLFESLWDHFAQPHHWRVFADVAGVWNALQARGYLLGIASNFDQRLRGILRAHAPLDRCEALFVSSQIGFPKPAPQFFAAVEQRLQLPAERILLVGDDEVNDLQGARAAGWQAVLLARGVPSERDDSIQSLAELLERLPAIV